MNLALSVGAPEGAKGFHPIASWFAAVDLADEIELTRLSAGAQSEHAVAWAEDAPLPSPIDWPLEKDLGVRAHRLLEEHLGRELPVRVRVRKRIPVGGGLGGGSSDAAAVLSGLDRLFGLGLNRAELIGLSTRLGSDVAFFLDSTSPPRRALVRGMGERVDRIVGGMREAGDEDRGQRVVLIFPGFGCPTGAVYRAFDEMRGEGGGGGGLREGLVRDLVSVADRLGSVPSERLFNDLARAACAVEPRLAALLDRLAALRLGEIHVTGSGSTLFALAEAGGASVLAAAIREHLSAGAGVVNVRLF